MHRNKNDIIQVLPPDFGSLHMFFFLLASTLCDDSQIFCFGSVKKCKDYARPYGFNLDNVLVDDVSKINDYLPYFRPNFFLMLPEPLSAPITIDISKYVIGASSTNIYIYGCLSSKKPDITIKFPELTSRFNITLYKVNTKFIFASKKTYNIDAIYLHSSYINLSTMCHCNYASYDDDSKINGPNLLTVLKEGYIDPDAPMDYLNISDSVMKPSIPASTSYIELGRVNIECYRSQNDHNVLASIPYSVETLYASYHDIFDPYEKKIEIFPNDPDIQDSSYSLNFMCNLVTLVFSGQYPDNIYNRFNVLQTKLETKVVLNSNYVPISFYGKFYLMTSSYNIPVRKSANMEVYSYFDTQDRIKIYGGDSISCKVIARSSNIDVYYQNFDTKEVEVFMDEKAISTVTFENSDIQGMKLKIVINYGFSTYFNDKALSSIYDRDIMITVCKIASAIDEFIVTFRSTLKDEKYSFIPDLFSFQTQTYKGKRIYIRKSKKVPEFTPDMFICNSSCNFDSSALWFKPNNISEIYNYFKPNCVATITISENVLGTLEFGKLPKFDENSILNIEFLTSGTIDVKGTIEINNLSLTKTRLNPVAPTKYNINHLTFFQSSSLFNDKATYSKEIKAMVDVSTMNNLPSDITDRTLVIRFEKMFFTETTFKIKSFLHQPIEIAPGFKFIALNSFEYYNEAGKPIITHSFQKVPIIAQIYDTVLRFNGNWEGSFIDFFDFSYSPYNRFLLYKDENYVLPFVDMNGYSWASKYITGEKNVCLRPDDSVQTVHCFSGDSKNFTIDEGLKYIETVHNTKLNIYIYQCEDIINFSVKHFRSMTVNIRSGDGIKHKIKLPNIMPSIQSLYLYNIIHVFDSKDDFLLVGSFDKIEYQKVNSGKFYYYYDVHDLNIINMFDISKFSLHYKKLNTNINDLTESIYIESNHDELEIRENEDVNISFTERYYSYRFESNPSIDIYFRYSPYKDGFFRIYIYGNKSAYISASVISNRFFTISAEHAKVYIDSPFDEISLGLGEFHITDKSGSQWGTLEIRQVVYFDTPEFNADVITYNTLDVNYYLFSSNFEGRCVINACIIGIDQLIYLNPNIDLNLTSMEETTYNYVHMISLTQVARVYMDHPNITGEIIIRLKPVINQETITEKDLAAFEYYTSFIYVNINQFRFKGKVEYLDSNIFGLMDGASILSFSQEINYLKFIANKKLDSLPIDVCYGGTSGNCSDYENVISFLSVNAINNIRKTRTFVNLYIMEDKVSSISLDFESNDLFLNFIHPGSEKCSIMINKLWNVSQLAFNNFYINASSDYHKGTPVKYKNCAFGKLAKQYYDSIHADIESFTSIRSSSEDVTIDPESTIYSLTFIGSYIFINGFRVYNYGKLKIYQRSLTNLNTLFIYDANLKFIINLQSDFRLKVFGRVDKAVTIQPVGNGILTCEVTDSTKNFFVNPINANQITKQLVEKSKVIYCDENCPSDGIQVPSSEIADRIKKDNEHELIEVLISDDTNLRLNINLLLGKYLHIKSESQANITLDFASFNSYNQAPIMLNFTNINVNIISSARNVKFHSLFLEHSRIMSDTVKKVGGDIYCQLDSYYFIPIGCLLIARDVVELAPIYEDSVDIPKVSFAIIKNGLEVVYCENSSFQFIGSKTASDRFNFSINSIEILSIYFDKSYSTQKLKFTKEDPSIFTSINISRTKENTHEFEIVAPDANYELYINGKATINGYFPKKLYLVGDTEFKYDKARLDCDLEVYNGFSTRFKLSFEDLNIDYWKIILKTGNIDMNVTGYLYIYSLDSTEIPFVMTIDDQGISTFNVTGRIPYKYDWNVLYLRTDFQKPPYEYSLSKALKNPIGMFNMRSDKHIFLKMINIGNIFHGVWDGFTVLELNIKKDFLYIDMNGSISKTPMNICVGSNQCPKDYIIINHDFALRDRVPFNLENLNIYLSKESDIKIDCKYDCYSLNFFIQPLITGETATVTFENVNLDISSLNIYNVSIKSTENWIMYIKKIVVIDSQLPAIDYDFRKSFAAFLDIDTLKVIKDQKMMSKLTIDKCESQNIIFTSYGWEFDGGFLLNKTELDVQYSKAIMNVLNLKVEKNNYICHGLRIAGYVNQIHCAGERGWRSSNVYGKIVWDHGASNVSLLSDTFFNPVTFEGSGKVDVTITPIPDKSSICFYEGDGSQCTATEKYPLTDFDNIMRSIPTFNIKIEIYATTIESIETDISVLENTLIDIVSLKDEFTIEVNMTDMDHPIIDLNLNKIIFELKGSYTKTLSIKSASLTKSKIIASEFTKNIVFETLVCDSESLPSNSSIKISCEINYNNNDYPESLIELLSDNAIVHFNGLSDLFTISNSPSLIKINDKISIKTNIEGEKIIFTDTSERNPNVTIFGSEYDSKKKYFINLIGNLNVTGKWWNNCVINVSMKGTIEAYDDNLAITMIGVIDLIVHDRLTFKYIDVTSNLSIHTNGGVYCEFKSVKVNEGSFINIESENTQFNIVNLESAIESLDVFPVTFGITQFSVPLLTVQSIPFNFRKIQIKCIATQAPSSVVQTKTLIKIKNGKIDESIIILWASERRYLGYWSGDSALNFVFSTNEIKLQYNSFSDRTLFLCLADTCDKGQIVTNDNINEMIPSGHKNIDITVKPLNNETTSIDIVDNYYQKIFVHATVSDSKAAIIFSPKDIRTFELENIEMAEYVIPSMSNFDLILANSNVSELKGVKSNYGITLDESSLQYSDYHLFKKISLKNLQSSPVKMNQASLTYQGFEFTPNDMKVEVSNNVFELIVDPLITTFDYSFSLITTKDIKLTLAGEWDKITSSSLSISHGSNMLNVIAPSSYSDPFILLGSGQVTQEYKPREKTIICVCDDGCSQCPQKSEVKSFEEAESIIRKISGINASLELYIATLNSVLEVDISYRTIPELSIINLQPNNKPSVRLVRSPESRFDKLKFDGIILTAVTYNTITTKEIIVINSELKSVSKIVADSAAFDTLDIGVTYITINGMLSLTDDFSRVRCSNNKVCVEATRDSYINPCFGFGSQVIINLNLSSTSATRNTLEVSDTTQYSPNMVLNIEVNIESTISLRTNFPVSFYAKEAVKFDISFSLRASFKCLKEADFQFKDSCDLNGKMILSADTTLESDSTIDHISINEIVLKDATVSGFIAIKKIIFGSIKLEGKNKTTFPFIFKIDNKVTEFEVGHFPSTVNELLFECSHFTYVNDLLDGKTNVIKVREPTLTGNYKLSWRNKEQKHGLWDGKSIFDLMLYSNIISLVPKYPSIEDIPGEICVCDSDNMVCSPTSITVWSSGNIPFNLFPYDIKYLNISIYPDFYQLYSDFSNKGIVYDIRGMRQTRTRFVNMPGMVFANFENVNLINFNFTLKLLSTPNSSVDLSGSVFHKQSLLDFNNSTVTLDYEALLSSFTATQDPAKLIKIQAIPLSITIKDANGKYPFVGNNILYSDSYEWNGPIMKSEITFVYGKFELANVESIFILNADVTITVQNFEGTEFQTNLKFQTNGHKITLKGMKFIPSQLFSNVKDVTIPDEPVPGEPTPTPAPKIEVADGIKGPDGIKITTFEPKGENVLLVGGANGVPDPTENLIISHLTIKNQNVESNNLILEKSLSITGGSKLKPAEDGKIDLKQNDTIEINFMSNGAKLPQLDIGNVGADYHIVPKEFNIKMDLSRLSENQIISEYGGGRVIVSGQTLNCEEWIEKIDISGIKGKSGFKFYLESSNSKSRLLNAPRRDILLKAQKDEEPGSSTTMTIIIVVVVIIVVIIVIIVAVVLIKKKKRRNSSSSNLSSNSGEFMDEL